MEGACRAKVARAADACRAIIECFGYREERYASGMVMRLGEAGKGAALTESVTNLVRSEQLRALLSRSLKEVGKGKKVKRGECLFKKMEREKKGKCLLMF